MKKVKLVALGILAIIVIVVSTVLVQTNMHKKDWPFYDEEPCKVTYSVCGSKLFKEGKADLEKVRAYFYETYGIAPENVGMLGSSGQTQGLEKMQIGTYRVVVKPGYSFVFTSVASNTEPHLEGFGYVHMNRLDETIGLMAGLFYEMKHGNGYEDIKKVLDSEELLYYQNDYEYNRSIWWMYDKDEFSIGNTDWKHIWTDKEYELAASIKTFLTGNDDGLDRILGEIEKIGWEPKIMIIPYTKNEKKYNEAIDNWVTSKSTTQWSVDIQNMLKKETKYKEVKIDIAIKKYKIDNEVKGWE